MQRRPVVVDGSNLATEGRSTPSLAQLDEAVRAWLAENPDDEVIVVVDASFSYRIDESEKQTFEDAEAAGEVVSPPAGALGRGDGFLLKIADRVDAAVLSNDSFQEFHGDYPWLFDSGRLLGGKPVPGVGWIFTPRTPVRGPKSRMAVRDAKRSSKKAELSGPVVKAIEEATAEVMEPREPEAKSGRRRRRGSREVSGTHEAVNDPLPFITFIAEHHLGTEVEGTVDSFTSHGAFVVVDDARCYVPVVGLGDPPPRTAKAVLKRGETRTFVVQALDPPRRGIELALPEVARVAGAPTAETVEAEIDEGAKREASAGPRRRTRARKAVAQPDDVSEADAAATAAVAAAVAAEPAPEAPAAAEPEAAPAVPKRPRRSTKKAGAPAIAASMIPGVGTAAADEQPPAPPKRTRRGAKKAAPEEAPQPGPEAAADEQPPPAPPKRTRRAAKKAAAPEVDPQPAAADEQQPPAPPKRTRRTAKKVATEPEAAAAPPAQRARRRRPPEPAPARAEEVASAPAPAKRTRKRAAPAAEADAAPPAPARKRAAKKTAAKEAAVTEAAAAAGAASRKRAPRRRDPDAS